MVAQRLLQGFWLVLWLSTLVACAGNERDTGYLLSEQRPALQVPAGLDTPDYNQQMAIPQVTAEAGVSVDTSINLEYPPVLDNTE